MKANHLIKFHYSLGEKMINRPGGVILVQFFEWLFIPSNRFKGVFILAIPFSLIIFFRATNGLLCQEGFLMRFSNSGFFKSNRATMSWPKLLLFSNFCCHCKDLAVSISSSVWEVAVPVSSSACRTYALSSWTIYILFLKEGHWLDESLFSTHQSLKTLDRYQPWA